MMSRRRAELRGIDHVVWEVRSLECAREAFAGLGFTMTPPAVHPFGTGNSLAQFSTSFIELLTVVDPVRIVPMSEGHYSFSSHAARFLETREGLSMLVLSSADARADNLAWRERGLRTYDVVDFARKARLPDGRSVEVAFSIAFAIDPGLPEIAFFVCQQHAPEHFWKADYQTHANGACDIDQVTLIADEPERHAEFFQRMLFDGEVCIASGGLVGETARGRIAVLAPERAAAIYPEGCLPENPHRGGFAAVHIVVSDLDEARRSLDSADISHVSEPSRLIVPANAAHNCALVFSERARASDAAR
jgi:hypothetical protein